jgi:hypothetical protein
MSEDTPEAIRQIAEDLVQFEEVGALVDEEDGYTTYTGKAFAALKRYATLLEQGNARIRELEGTVKSILDHINRGNEPERYAGRTDFGTSQDRGMTISFIKSLAEEALR